MNDYDDRRMSGARADLINEHLPAGSTILDFGAYKGAIARRLAAHGHHVTAVSPELEDDTGITAIRATLDPDGIRALGQFDVALCLSVLHHLRNWRDYVHALESISSVVFYEHAIADEDSSSVAGRPALRRFIEREVEGEVIGRFPGKDGNYLRPLLYRATT